MKTVIIFVAILAAAYSSGSATQTHRSKRGIYGGGLGFGGGLAYGGGFVRAAPVAYAVPVHHAVHVRQAVPIVHRVAVPVVVRSYGGGWSRSRSYGGGWW